MDDQPPLFDLPAGEAAKTNGMALASASGVAVPWQDRAEAALAQLCRTGWAFTADDLVAIAGLPSEGVNANNAVGAFISGAARRGVIRKTGAYRKSERTLAHARVVAVWQPD